MSGLSCSACSDARRPEIDAALVSGSSLRDIAGRYGTSKSALSRHRPHVGTALVRASERKAERFEETLLSKVERLEADARRLGEKAETEGDLRCALVAVRELLDVARLLREMTPAPKPTPADVERVLAWQAEEIGCTVDELRAESERLAQIQAEILAGRTPPHTVWPASVVSAPALAAPAPAPVTPVPAAPAPAPPPAAVPFKMSL